MFSSLKNFLSRHKRKFAVTGIVVGGAVLALRYAQRKIVEYQEEQAREFILRTKRSQHFESTERTCNQAIMGVASTLCEQLLAELNAEPILEQLRKNPENKRELWEELKILAFTRLTTLIYASSMLVVTLRIQINVLGGYLYKDSMSTETKITNEIQEHYLSLSQYLIQQGIKSLSCLIETKVRQVLSGYDLKQHLTLADTEQIFWSLQMAVNSDVKDPNSQLAKYVFPKDINGLAVFTKMYTETLDMFESDDTSSLCTNNISRGFSLAMDSIADFYEEPIKEAYKTIGNGVGTSKSDLNVVPNLNSIQLPLAKLIPIINGLAAKVFDTNLRPQSLSTSLITLFVVSDKLKMLGANVYEVFSQ